MAGARSADPTLTRSSVTISYASSDGFSSGFSCKAGKGCQHEGADGPVPPETALITGLAELARLTALFGFEDRALEAFNTARERVARWRKETGRA